MSTPRFRQKINNWIQEAFFDSKRHFALPAVSIFLIGAGALLGLLGWRYFAVDGTMRIVQDFSERKNAFVSVFTPGSVAGGRLREEATKRHFQHISGTPALMEFDIPRAFNAMEATITFHPRDQRLVDIAVPALRNSSIGEYRPLYIALVEEARAAGWHEKRDAGRGMTVLTRSPLEQLNAEEGLDAIIERAQQQDLRIAYYSSLSPLTLGLGRNIAAADEATADTDEERSNKLEITTPLRGEHQFVTRIHENEVLSLRIFLQDINQVAGKDDVQVTILNAKGETVHIVDSVDDGNVSADGVISSERVLAIEVPQLQSGIYLIHVSASADSILTKIQTEQSHFVVLSRLQIASPHIMNGIRRPADVEESPFTTTVYSRARRVIFESHQFDAGDALGTVNGRLLYLEHGRKKVQWLRREQGEMETLQRIQPADDRQTPTIIHSSAPISFSEEAYFEPFGAAGAIDYAMQLSDVDLIIVPTTPEPVVNAFERIQTVTLPLTHILGDRKTPQLLLSVPGLEFTPDAIDLYRVDVEFSRRPLYQRLLDRLFN